MQMMIAVGGRDVLVIMLRPRAHQRASSVTSCSTTATSTIHEAAGAAVIVSGGTAPAVGVNVDLLIVFFLRHDVPVQLHISFIRHDNGCAY
jgi:hypothetical protein